MWYFEYSEAFQAANIFLLSLEILRLYSFSSVPEHLFYIDIVAFLFSIFLNFSCCIIYLFISPLHFSEMYRNLNFEFINLSLPKFTFQNWLFISSY